MPEAPGPLAAGDRVTSQGDSGSVLLAHFDLERRWCPLNLLGPLVPSAFIELQSYCLVLDHLVIHFHITFSWVLEEKQVCVPQKK